MFDSIAQNTQVPETINDSRMETDVFHWSRMNVIWIIHKHSFVDIMLVNVYKKIQKTSTTRVNEYKFTQRYEDWHMPSTFIRVCVLVHVCKVSISSLLVSSKNILWKNGVLVVAYPLHRHDMMWTCLNCCTMIKTIKHIPPKNTMEWL